MNGGRSSANFLSPSLSSGKVSLKTLYVSIIKIITEYIFLEDILCYYNFDNRDINLFFFRCIVNKNLIILT